MIKIIFVFAICFQHLSRTSPQIDEFEYNSEGQILFASSGISSDPRLNLSLRFQTQIQTH